ncbi:MAG TPA: TerB family tellurite resistance protein [Kofleriaceae bacterium]|nr:TerB family tellurite resistance protein [Kofleriaceae bacterium]
MNANMARCLVVSKVLVADGMMTDEEHGFLAAMMGRLGLSPDEQRRVIELEGLDEADRIVAALSADERREIVALLVDAASADGKLSPHELAAVKRVTAALGL